MMTTQRKQELEKRATAHLEKYPDDVEAVHILTDFAVAVEREVWESSAVRGKLWSFFRALLSQGGDIQMDYKAGRYASYEEYSTRLDAAARERVEQWCREQMKETES